VCERENTYVNVRMCVCEADFSHLMNVQIAKNKKSKREMSVIYIYVLIYEGISVCELSLYDDII
jgi:hypothetical protein